MTKSGGPSFDGPPAYEKKRVVWSSLWDANAVFDVLGGLSAVAARGDARLFHDLERVVDGVEKDAHILDEHDLFRLRGRVEKTLAEGLSLADVEPLICLLYTSRFFSS